ncbi:hypothetical protein BDV23DRAFT_181455 [Aspergillus alliaceus]|uniref:DUF7703 domain-containing protein n=1 Tax=Petromyces alliaceus TaxID=209559 RepID=A0A5N7CEF5_PETAA|nr:hypothetical protein BDV23DRAFT_181455 [Aspergillus alliaceus]
MSTVKSPAEELIQHSTIDQVQKYVIAAFCAVVWYNAIELVVLCLITFKRYRGCYFWSLFIASASLIPHGLGFIFFIYPLGVSPYISVTLIVTSWYCMVTGHSLVLWSRLHLVLQAPRLLRALLAIIIIDAVAFHVPTTICLYGTISSAPGHPNHFARGYRVMEHTQLIGFAVQESILSGLYIWETGKMLRLRQDRVHYAILIQLLTINIVILILDVAVVGIEYAGYYSLQVMFKPVAYSVKFKLEYAILGKLIQIAQASSSSQDPLSSSSRGQEWFTSAGQSGSGSNGAPTSEIVREIPQETLCTGFSRPDRMQVDLLVNVFCKVSVPEQFEACTPICLQPFKAAKINFGFKHISNTGLECWAGFHGKGIESYFPRVGSQSPLTVDREEL